eukprot:Hpha_TRINITY_DN16227_c0_g1::TRINITY_DN16227_c0_g1_i1::g.12712::m.12712
MIFESTCTAMNEEGGERHGVRHQQAAEGAQTSPAFCSVHHGGEGILTDLKKVPTIRIAGFLRNVMRGTTADSVVMDLCRTRVEGILRDKEIRAIQGVISKGMISSVKLHTDLRDMKVPVKVTAKASVGRRRTYRRQSRVLTLGFRTRNRTTTSAMRTVLSTEEGRRRL